jgi:hypothetical protein
MDLRDRRGRSAVHAGIVGHACLAGLIGLSCKTGDHFMMPRPLALSAHASSQVTLSIPIPPTSGGVVVNYLTDASSEPQTFGNRVYAWQTTSNTVPWNKTFVADAPVPTNSSSGTMFVGFSYQPVGYILGYAVAASPQAVCSTVYVPQGGQGDPTQWVYASASCSVAYSSANLVQVNYTVLANYLPATNRNWVGIWQGTSVPYQGDPLAWSDVPTDAQSGSVILQGLGLTINTSYAVGYFFQDKATGRTALGAQTTFTLSST